MYASLKRAARAIRSTLLAPLVLGDYLAFRGKDARPRFRISLRDLYPQPFDRTLQTGFDRHYVYHTSWAARVLAETKPRKHVDVSSSLYFGGIVSAFVPVEFYDYRPADLALDGFDSRAGNLMELPFEDASVDSLSCMHTVEHVGLGRYGDPIDPDGDLKAAKELARVLAEGGTLLFVVPMGETARIAFNAHRVYSYDAVLALFPGLVLEEFALIPERAGSIVRHADLSLLAGESYACGCFRFTKKP